MTRIRPWLIPLQILIASALVFGVAWTAIAAAPGPLKADAVPTASADTEADENDSSEERWQPLNAAPSDTRLEYQGGSALSGGGSDPGTSHRPAIAGRTAAGSSPEDEVETPVPIPKAEATRTAPRPPKRMKLAQAPYIIEESGRPRHSTDSGLAYDGDPATSWSTGTLSPMAYAWFDLGEERPVAGLRWFQTVIEGPVAIQISNDREQWTTVELREQPVADSWQQADISQPARFVRIVLNTENGVADLAEVQIFGPPGSEPRDEQNEQVVSARQQPVENRPPSVRVTGNNEQNRQAAESAFVVTPEADSEAVEISVNGEVTRCSGGERCRVESRQPEIVEDCGDGTTTCTIRIGVSAGLAVCDSSGGSGGRNSGTGGRCAAEASGGTVEIGDVNR